MISTYWANESLKKLYLSNGSGSLYVGLSSTIPEADGTGISEPPESNYTRMELTSFSDPVNGEIVNAKSIDYPLSTSDWFPKDRQAVCYVLFDGAGEDAHFLGASEFLDPITIESNSRFSLAAGCISIRCEG